MLFIFIQGSFLLNGHVVTLTLRLDGGGGDDDSFSTANNANSSNTYNYRDYSRSGATAAANELRLRDWDCYKVNVVQRVRPRRGHARHGRIL